jgi:hypothetical protein
MMVRFVSSYSIVLHVKLSETVVVAHNIYHVQRRENPGVQVDIVRGLSQCALQQNLEDQNLGTDDKKVMWYATRP